MKKYARNRWLMNLALLAGIAILSTILILGEKPEPVIATLSKFIPHNINQITIARQGKKDIVFLKQGSFWKMTSPYTIHADDAQVQTLLGMAQLEIKGELGKPEGGLEKFGLASPHTTVQFNGTKILFGGIQPVGKQRYIQVGSEVMLVDDHLAAQLNTSSLSMIDRQLIPKGSSIKSISPAEHPPITLNGGGDNQSIITQWQTIKATWISLHPETELTGTSVSIAFNGNEPSIEYIAQQRETDLVLIRKDMSLEYHLPLPAAQTLGLVAPQNNPDTLQPTNPE